MLKCIHCKREIMEHEPIVWWGLDGDPCCSQACYNAEKREMDIEHGVPTSRAVSRESDDRVPNILG